MRYYVADLHIGHDKVADIRGFDSTSEHDQAVLNQIRELPHNSELWILGDVVGRDEHTDHGLELLKEAGYDNRLRMHLIAGNHDRVSSIHRNGWKHLHDYLEVFQSVQQFTRHRISGEQVMLSHFPYKSAGDGPGREGSRYNEYRLPDEGFPLVHGHTHQLSPHAVTEMSMYGWKANVFNLDMFCVSWDAQRRIATEHELNLWIEKWRADRER